MSHIKQCSKVPCKAQTCVRYTGLAYQFQAYTVDSISNHNGSDSSLRKKRCLWQTNGILRIDDEAQEFALRPGNEG